MRGPLLSLCAWLLLSACAGVPILGGGGGPGGIRGPVKIALVDVFSGTAAGAPMGTYLQDSLQVEIDDLNARGGLLGTRVQLVTADDELSLTKTPDVVRRMLADRSVKLLVGPSFAGLYLGAKPLVERAGVVNCLTSMAADDVMESAPYSFREQEQDGARVPALLSYVQRGSQLKKIGLVTDDDSVGHGYDRQLSEQAGKFGLQYLGAAFFTGAADQRSQVQQMLQRGAEALVLSGSAPTATRTLQTLQALKAQSRVRTFGFAGLGSYSFVQQAGDLANGVVFVSPIQSYLSDVPEARWPPAYRDFTKRVLARFGAAANGVEMKGLPAGGACVLDWASAVRAANDFDGTRVARAWETLDVPAAQSVLGVHEQFSPSDHDAVPPDSLFVYQWARNGAQWGLRQLAAPPA